MSSLRLLTSLAGSLAAAAMVAACSASPDAGGADPSGETEDELAATEPVFGDDRVGDALRGKTDKIPTSLPAVEALFGVGRACTRADSKEIFVVEETQARLPSGVITPPGALVPRAVVAGCNTGDLTDPASVERSYSLFVALISDPSRAEQTRGDGIVQRPVEVMALDRKTGTFNFYVFDERADGKPELTRIYRRDDGQVVERRIVAKGRATPPARPANDSSRCFSCHVHGAPLMNEMRDPWTNWISFKKNLPLSRLTGDTQALVSEAVPSATTSRSSLANDLEPIMRAAIRAHVSGTTNRNGWARAEVKRPGGLARALSSVFCETELNYATSTDAVPIESFIDPDVSNGDLVPPDAFGESATPIQMPIRSELDRSVESFLVDRGYLTYDMTLAVRLFDDESDIFSDARCGLARGAAAAIGALSDPKAIKEKLRAFLLEEAARASFKASQPKRHAYLVALLQPRPNEAELEAAATAYAAELAPRFEALKSDRTRVKARDKARKERARAMFPGTSSPLPLLP